MFNNNKWISIWGDMIGSVNGSFPIQEKADKEGKLNFCLSFSFWNSNNAIMSEWLNNNFVMKFNLR